MTKSLLELPILGMKKESCAAAIESALEGNEPVVEVSVDVAAGMARITSVGLPIDLYELAYLIRQAGYEVDREKVRLPVRGMSCISCAIHVKGVLEDGAGVLEAEVDLASQEAIISAVVGQVNWVSLRQAVEEAGYRLITNDLKEGSKQMKLPQNN